MVSQAAQGGKSGQQEETGEGGCESVSWDGGSCLRHSASGRVLVQRELEFPLTLANVQPNLQGRY